MRACCVQKDDDQQARVKPQSCKLPANGGRRERPTKQQHKAHRKGKIYFANLFFPSQSTFLKPTFCVQAFSLAAAWIRWEIVDHSRVGGQCVISYSSLFVSH
jgi:hypothetical protein